MSTTTQTTTARRLAARSRGLVLAVGLALAATACAGGTDDVTDAPADQGEEAALPTDDDPDDTPISSGMCIEDEPDCEDMVVVGDDSEPLGDDAAGGGASSSCLEGDEDCTDESYDGQDVTRTVPVVGDQSGAEPATRGVTQGATGAPIDEVVALEDTTLQVTFTSGTCDLVEDVLVIESPEEVRLLVLTGQDPAVEVCTADVQQWTVDVDLSSPVRDRAVLDISG